MTGKHFKVANGTSFYESMVGKAVMEFDMTVLIEFKMNEQMGGTHKVMFYKNDVTPSEN